MIDFVWLPVFCLLPVPLLFRGRGGKENSAAIKVPFFDEMKETVFAGGKKRRTGGAFLPWVLWVLLVTAAARPQISGGVQEYAVPVRDIVLALDISSSMLLQDMDENRKSRLEIVKEAAAAFVGMRKNDRIGIVLFSEQAGLYVPLTVDSSVLNQMLKGVQTGLLGKLTAVGDALGLSLKHLEGSKAPRKVIVLLTDGISNAGNLAPDDALEIAKRKNVTVYTIGAGSDNDQKTAVDTEFLRRTAAETNGLFFMARDGQAVADAYADISQNEPLSETSVFLMPKKEVYHIPLLMFALISSFVVFRRLIGRIVFAVGGRKWK